MADRVVKWAALLITAVNLAILVPPALTPRRWTDDVNTHYFWLNFRPGEYQFADELRRFQSIGWRVLGSALSLTPVPPTFYSGLLTLLLYGGFLGAAYAYARRRVPGSPAFAAVFVLLLSLHPTLARDVAGGLPRSWAPLLQMLGLLTALEFSKGQAGALILAALMHPISFLINAGTICIEWAYRVYRHLREGTPLRESRMWAFAGVVVALLVVLQVDQARIARLDGKILTVRRHEAFNKGYRSETDQIRDFLTALRRKYASSDDLDYNYVLFTKRLNYEDHPVKRGEMRQLARTRRYLILVLCAVALVWAIRSRQLPRELIWWGLTGTILYHLAVLLAWRLYAPDRYIFPAAIVIPSWLLAVFFAGALRRLRWLGVVPLVVFVLLWGTGVHPSYVYKNWDAWAGAAGFIRDGVPREALIAGHPRDMDPLPLMTGRKVYVAREFIQPWRPALYDRNMQRAENAIGMVYLTADRVDLLRRVRVDYLLIGKQWLRDRYIKGEASAFDEPIGSNWKHILSQTPEKDLVFQRDNLPAIQSAVVYEDETFVLVAVERLLPLLTRTGSAP
ncbi:MAG: hypothetical protein Kow0059_11610 [Candidatus Sumerlaeia bacterium]